MGVENDNPKDGTNTIIKGNWGDIIIREEKKWLLEIDTPK
jgi:hypothetical protein